MTTMLNAWRSIKILQTFFQPIIKTREINLLGRWKPEYCQIKLDKKIDLANEDHCGPCGNIITQKTPFKI